MIAIAPQPTKTLIGLDAIRAYLPLIQPKSGSSEIWLKFGHNIFYKGVIDGERLSLWKTKGGENERVICDHIVGDGWEYLLKLSQQCDGGVFYIPTQPQGFPLKECVNSTDDIAIEIDGISREKQLARYAEFEQISGIEFAALLSSGGKSVHGHAKFDQHYPLNISTPLRRLMTLALRSDPAVVNVHQPTRFPGFYRREKQAYQKLLSIKPACRYTADFVESGLKCWFNHLGWTWPNTDDFLNDEWWGEFQRLISSASSLSESEKVEQIGALLAIGFEGWQAQQEEERRERARIRAAKRAKVELSGQFNLVEAVEEVCDRVGSEAFDWPGHNWQWRGSKARGCCPWHDSKSGTAGWITEYKNQWVYNCQACFGKTKLNAFQYWWKCKKDNAKASLPTGIEYVEAVKEFLQLYGVHIPSYEHKSSDPPYARQLDEADRERWEQERKYAREKSKQSLIDKIKGIYQRAITPKALQVKANSSPKPIQRHSEADITYAPGERLATWQRLKEQGYRYILDISGTGEGKSFDTGNAEPKDFGVNQLIYATDQQRNPTNDTLNKENGWVGLESRHDGLVKETTVNGGIRLRRRKPSDPTPKRYDSISLQANCNRVGLISTLRSKNVAGADSADVVCATCPLKNACLHTDGVGKGNYGYLYQRKNAIPSPKLRSHPDSLPSPSQYDYSRTGLVWDEVSQNFDYSQKLSVTRPDIDQTIAQLAIADLGLFQELLPLLKKLVEIFEGKLPKFGIDCLDLVGELLPLLPADIDADEVEQALQPDFSFLNTTAEYGVDLADLPPAVQRQFTEKDAEAAKKADENVVLQWLALLIRILQKTQRGYLSVAKIKASSNPYIKAKIPALMLWFEKVQHHAVVDAAAFNVFLDATISKERLARMLWCDQAEIVVVCQRSEELDNLQIDQIFDCGRMGMQRGKDQQRRADALVRHYKAIDPTTKVMDFKAFDADGAWWRDSRGVNDFLDCETLVLIGTPCPNLTELKARYTMLNGLVPSEGNGKLEDFQRFVDEDIAGEIKQAIGRLRNNRRKETKLRVILISNFGLSIPTNKIKAKDVTFEAASKKEQAEQLIIDAVNLLKAAGEKVTQMAISAITGITQSQISRDFRNLLQTLLDPTNSKSDNPDLDDYAPIVESAISDSNSIQQTSEVIDEIFTHWLQTDIDRAALFDRLNHHTKTTILSTLMAFACPDLEVMT